MNSFLLNLAIDVSVLVMLVLLFLTAMKFGLILIQDIQRSYKKIRRSEQ